MQMIAVNESARIDDADCRGELAGPDDHAAMMRRDGCVGASQLRQIVSEA